MKKFFKSGAFKCVITLLCVLLISGSFLTISYGFLEVTDEEREARSIKKIYGENAKIEKILEPANYNDDAEIIKGYFMADGNYLIKSLGRGGYQGGTVTCWVVVKADGGAVSGIGKVVIHSQTKQTLMDQYSNDKVLDVFSQNYNGEPFTAGVITGATATQTNTAIKNSVNGAVDFVKAQLGDVWEDPFKDFNYFFLDNIVDHKLSSYRLNGDGSVTFKIVTKGYGYAGSFTISITVGTDGLIKEGGFIIEVDGSTSSGATFWGDRIPQAVKDGTMFYGKGLNFFTDVYGPYMLEAPIESFDDNSVTTGATTDEIASLSTYQCFYAGAYATANYQKAVEWCNAHPEGDD